MAAELIKIHPANPEPRKMAEVVQALRKGALVIYPTDTVYGLGCDITQPKSIERIARIKGIKVEKNNFSFICTDLSNLADYTFCTGLSCTGVPERRFVAAHDCTFYL